MRTGVLKIDFIDDGAEETKDYIGSVRVPLKQLLMEQEVADTF